MIRKSEGRQAPWLLVCLSLVLTGGCSRTLVEQAIEARGGAMSTYSRVVSAEVLSGMPGTWAWEVDFEVPSSFRWSLETFGEDQTLLFDGETVRYRLGAILLPARPGDAATRSQARWFGVTTLDVLTEAGVRWRELDPSEIPGPYRRGLRATFDDLEEPFDLLFDEDLLLGRASGMLAVPPIGRGRVDATFSDYRRVGGLLLPFEADYHLEGRPYMVEKTHSWRPNLRFGAGAFAGQ